MPRLVNLTKHPLTLYDVQGRPVTLPPDPRHVGPVGIGEHRTAEDEAGHVYSVNELQVRAVKGMPEPEAGTVFIVPVEVAMALQERRDDVVFAAENARVRDADGRMQHVSHLRRMLSRTP